MHEGMYKGKSNDVVGIKFSSLDEFSIPMLADMRQAFTQHGPLCSRRDYPDIAVWTAIAAILIQLGVETSADIPLQTVVARLRMRLARSRKSATP